MFSILLLYDVLDGEYSLKMNNIIQDEKKMHIYIYIYIYICLIIYAILPL